MFTHRTECLVLATLLALTCPGIAHAVALSIYDIQYTTDPAGASPQDGNLVDCAGGIVTHKFAGSRPRLVLYDPDHSSGWGGIQVKDSTANELFGAVSVGDWVSLTNVLVEDHRGTTFLQYQSQNAPNHVVESTDNDLPEPIAVPLAEIAAPVEGPPDEWHVADHSAEKYESMWLKVENIAVIDMDLGKAADNYNLHNADGDAWASDYMNADSVGDYHPLVTIGQEFVSVTGILEQYTKPSAGWDYYQLLTTCSDDLVVPEPLSLVMLIAAVPLLARRRR